MSAVNLTNLFGGKIFRVPDYQRGYAWKEKQLNELWDDLDQIAMNNEVLKKHYTGTIYLEEVQPPSADSWLTGVKFYNIVDGQQRLTTLSILLFELIKAAGAGYAQKRREKLIETFLFESNMSGESKVYKFGYARENNNHDFLIGEIFEDGKVLSAPGHRNHYTKNLMEAKEFFRSRIDEQSPEDRELLFLKVTTALHFDIRMIEKDLDVQAVFETMNNRGKPLSTLEKLKNRLIYLSEKLGSAEEDKQALRRRINQGWGKIYTWLAQNPDHILNEDVFLSAHLSLYRKPKEATFSENMAEEKVFEMFCNKPETYNKDESGLKEDSISYHKIDDYIIRLSELAPVWYEIHNSDSALVKKINLLNSSKEIKIFLAAVINKVPDQQKVQEIFVNLEKVLFRNRIPGLWVIDERTPASWARDLYNNKEHAAGINQKLLALVDTEVIVPNMIHQFRNLFTYERGAKGFYRWGGLKYFLFEYEGFLKTQARETDHKVTIDHFGDTTIEHVIPVEFRDNWNHAVEEVTSTLSQKHEIDQAEKVIVNTLGNLTILKGEKNSSVGNSGWDAKKQRFTTGSYNEIAISRADSWTKNEIAERGREMLKFLESRIDGLKFTEQDMESILFYDEYIINIIYDRKALEENTT